MKTVTILFATLACAPLVAAPSARPLARPPGAVDCIASRATAGRPAKGDDGILFTLDGKTYRNRLRSVCPGLSRLGGTSTLETEPHGSQLCAGDTVRVFDPTTLHAIGGAAGIDAYPRCELGWFEPVPMPAKH